jgi:hypothetical protein
MRKLKVALIFLSVFTGFSSAFAMGHDQGNGGNIIECNGQRLFSYSLDYILMRTDLRDKMNVADAVSIESSLNRINKLLREKAPQLSESFSTFVRSIQNAENESLPYIWKKGSYSSFPEIDDQDFSRVPGFCIGVVEIYQAIYRTQEDDKIVFYYDRDLIARLPNLQQSFLYVHEWLWNFSKDVKKNRYINYLLHSTQIETMSSTDVIKNLRNYDIIK